MGGAGAGCARGALSGGWLMDAGVCWCTGVGCTGVAILMWVHWCWVYWCWYSDDCALLLGVLVLVY